MPPMFIDGRYPMDVTSLNASVSVQTPYLQEGSGTKFLAVPAPANNDTLAILTATQTLAAKTLVNPIIQGGSVNAATLTQPVITTGTLSSPTIQTPVMTGGSWASGTLTQPVITTGLLSSPTIQSPSITGGTWTSGTLTSPILVGASIVGLGASTATVEAAVATDALMTPYNTRFHPAAAKAWAKVEKSAVSLMTAFNITSVQNIALGIYDVCFSTPFATTGYIVVGNTVWTAGVGCIVVPGYTSTVSTQTIYLLIGSNNSKDDGRFSVVFFGTE